MWGDHGRHALYQEGSHPIQLLSASGQDLRMIISINAQHSQALQEQLTPGGTRCFSDWSVYCHFDSGTQFDVVEPHLSSSK